MGPADSTPYPRSRCTFGRRRTWWDTWVEKDARVLAVTNRREALPAPCRAPAGSTHAWGTWGGGEGEGSVAPAQGTSITHTQHALRLTGRKTYGLSFSVNICCLVALLVGMCTKGKGISPALNTGSGTHGSAPRAINYRLITPL